MPTDTTAIKTVSVADLHKENDVLVFSKGKTGAGRLSIMRQKAFCDNFMERNKDATRGAAKREYAKYRQEHAKEFTARVVDKMQKGDLLVNAASISKGGHVRGVSFLTPRDASSVRITDAQRSLAKELNLSEEALEKLVIAGRRAAKEENASIDVKTAEVPATGEAVAASA